jgi:hypothetical protein
MNCIKAKGTACLSVSYNFNKSLYFKSVPTSFPDEKITMSATRKGYFLKSMHFSIQEDIHQQ